MRLNIDNIITGIKWYLFSKREIIQREINKFPVKSVTARYYWRGNFSYLLIDLHEETSNGYRDYGQVVYLFFGQFYTRFKYINNPKMLNGYKYENRKVKKIKGFQVTPNKKYVFIDLVSVSGAQDSNKCIDFGTKEKFFEINEYIRNS